MLRRSYNGSGRDCVDAYLNTQLSHLNALKAALREDIENSVKEAEGTLALNTVKLTKKYSQYLRHYEKDNLILFNYETSPLLAEFYQQHMPNFVLMSPGQYRDQLLRLDSNQVEMFNFDTETWGRPAHLLHTVKVDYYSMHAQVDESRIPLRTQSFKRDEYEPRRLLINFVSGIVEELQPLSVARTRPGVRCIAPGVLRHEGELCVALFVFGSNLHTAYHFDQREMKEFPKKMWKCCS